MRVMKAKWTKTEQGVHLLPCLAASLSNRRLVDDVLLFATTRGAIFKMIGEQKTEAEKHGRQ